MMKLADLRRARGLSQRDLAILANLAQPTIALAETGQRRFGDESRRRVLAGLGLTEAEARRVVELAPRGDS